METKILVKSSSREEPYTISVLHTNDKLSVFCDCPAGEWGKYCKHKISFVLGDTDILFDKSEVNDFNKAYAQILNSNYPKLANELKEYENEVEIAKKRLKKAKSKIARLMKEGSK